MHPDRLVQSDGDMGGGETRKKESSAGPKS